MYIKIKIFLYYEHRGAHFIIELGIFLGQHLSKNKKMQLGPISARYANANWDAKLKNSI